MIKTVVAVIIYDRFRNLQEWTRCWKMSETENAELVIIHNYKHSADLRIFSTHCASRGIKYISRPNRGFDIGAFQDVCKDRLPGFPTDYDYLLWCTDDIFPQRKTFIKEYLDCFSDPSVKAAAYELSKEVHPHIRTTGFMLHKETLKHIKFNVDPITTKIQCYEFEHRDKVNSIVDQINRIGKAVQVGDVETGAMWDTGHRSREAINRRSRREREHRQNFPI